VQEKKYFTAKDVAIILNELNYPVSKAEIDQMVWEVDENLDGEINKYEFELMYKRCRHD
jgi:Ca2+-binding EF-hand superfamily protein